MNTDYQKILRVEDHRIKELNDNLIISNHALFRFFTRVLNFEEIEEDKIGRQIYPSINEEEYRIILKNMIHNTWRNLKSNGKYPLKWGDQTFFAVIMNNAVITIYK